MPLGMEVGLGPGRIVLHGDTAPLPLPKGAQPHPRNFPSVSIVTKRSPISATVEHLFLGAVDAIVRNELAHSDRLESQTRN